MYKVKVVMRNKNGELITVYGEQTLGKPLLMVVDDTMEKAMNAPETRGFQVDSVWLVTKSKEHVLIEKYNWGV